MCARGTLESGVQKRMAALVVAVFRAAHREMGRPPTFEECLNRIEGHLANLRQRAVATRSALPKRVRPTDGFRQVPVGNRPAPQASRVRKRSADLAGEEPNAVGLCTAHLRAVQLGHVRVRGRAPDGLVWELGEPPDEEPLE